MIFRQATEADVPVIMQIRLAVRENILSNPARITVQMCVDYLDQLGRGWVCEIDGRIVGFSYAAAEDSSIWALFVLPEFEGRGAGKVLLDLASDYLFSLGNRKVSLGTQANTRADAFYLSRGWERGGMLNDIEVGYVLHRKDMDRFS
ncbi:GNAT family N-acetyltransferase [Undibacterium sp.]|jgi:GNAT superfamily N-acetyltransferase|uniref:GNAT family N-acetyltransferase n=1 Tax=Undibacterium sp. TaxID=1914977 RepID=UPI002CD0DE48|nr:GNAT family N-acetyltransferase [Undibacterium sp.]HTD05777.1 GNAT family N-acetyltransferase [Undibacterium sp.]